VQALDPEQRPHAGEQLRLVDRLREEIVGAGLDALHALLGGIEGGHHDHRQHRGRLRLAELLAHLVARHPRHHDVEQHEVGTLGFHLLERLLPGRRRHHGIALRPQQVGEQLDVDRRIVDHEDLVAGHRRRIASTAAMNSFTFSGLD
jgi:hypothetical protein